MGISYEGWLGLALMERQETTDMCVKRSLAVVYVLLFQSVPKHGNIGLEKPLHELHICMIFGSPIIREEYHYIYFS